MSSKRVTTTPLLRESDQVKRSKITKTSGPTSHRTSNINIRVHVSANPLVTSSDTWVKETVEAARQTVLTSSGPGKTISPERVYDLEEIRGPTSLADSLLFDFACKIRTYITASSASTAIPDLEPPTSTLGFYGKSGTGKSHNLLQVLRGLSRLMPDVGTGDTTQVTLGLSAIEFRGTYNSMQPNTHPRDLLHSLAGDNRLVPDFKSQDAMLPGLWGSKFESWSSGQELEGIVDRIDKRRTTARTSLNARSSRRHVVYILTISSLATPSLRPSRLILFGTFWYFCGTERSGIAPKDATQEEVAARQLETNNIVQDLFNLKLLATAARKGQTASGPAKCYLTYLFRLALALSFDCTMVLCVSAADPAESHRTLVWGLEFCQVKTIRSRPIALAAAVPVIQNPLPSGEGSQTSTIVQSTVAESSHLSVMERLRAERDIHVKRCETLEGRCRSLQTMAASNSRDSKEMLMLQVMLDNAQDENREHIKERGQHGQELKRANTALRQVGEEKDVLIGELAQLRQANRVSAEHQRAQMEAIYSARQDEQASREEQVTRLLQKVMDLEAELTECQSALTEATRDRQDAVGASGTSQAQVAANDEAPDRKRLREVMDFISETPWPTLWKPDSADTM